MSSHYTLASRAASTAALAASNAATNCSTAAKHYTNAVQALIDALNGNGSNDVTYLNDYITFCMEGVAEASAEADEAKINAGIAFEVAAGAAKKAQEEEMNLNGEEEGIETASVSGEWNTLKESWVNHEQDNEDIVAWWNPPQTESVPVSPWTVSPWTTTNVLSQAQANLSQYGTALSSPSPRTSEPPLKTRQEPKPTWGKQIGTWTGGMLTKKDSKRTLHTAYGAITEILPFNVFVAVAPTSSSPLSTFKCIGEPFLRELADSRCAIIPGIGDMALGFCTDGGDEPGNEVMFGYGRVVDVVVDERVYLVSNGNEDVGVDVVERNDTLGETW